MNVLLESPLAVGALGAVFMAAAAIVFSQTRSRGAFVSVALAVLLTIAGVAVERMIQTARERVLATVDALFVAIRANDLPAVLGLIDPQATEMRADAETLMPRFEVESAGKGGAVRIDLPADSRQAGARATATLKPLIKVQHKQSGATGAYFDGLELSLTRRGDRWLFSGYTPAKDWREGAAKLGR